MYGIDFRERHLPVCIRPPHAGTTSGFMVWGAISYNSQSHLLFLQDKVSSARYIAQVNLVLPSFLLQEGDVILQQVRRSILGGVVNFHLKIFNLGARRGGDVHFLIVRLYITVLD